jgi:hypothetical protein
MAHKIFTESSDGFLNLRWNYSPLKEKAVPLPGGLFVCDALSVFVTESVITRKILPPWIIFWSQHPRQGLPGVNIYFS